MFKNTRRLASVLAVTAAASALAAGTASADPVGARDSLPLTVDCGSAGSFDVTTNGNGNWTPAHDLNSTTMLIPVAFGPSTSTLTDSEGNIVDQQTDAGGPKGSANPAGRTLLDCSFSGGASFDDLTFTLEGTVTGFVTGKK